jgi:hypothetical protein
LLLDSAPWSVGVLVTDESRGEDDSDMITNQTNLEEQRSGCSEPSILVGCTIMTIDNIISEYLALKQAVGDQQASTQAPPGMWRQNRHKMHRFNVSGISQPEEWLSYKEGQSPRIRIQHAGFCWWLGATGQDTAG